MVRLSLQSPKGAKMRRLMLTLAVPVLASVAAGCGSSSSASHTSPAAKTPPAKVVSGGQVKVQARKLPKLGEVLVSASGRTLYVFAPDKASRVSCSASCQSIWPPLAAPSSGKATAIAPVKSTLIGSDRNPIGGRVVTYDGWPLYTYVGDSGPGTANGQAKVLNGGAWYVISPSGKPIGMSGQTATSSSGGYSSGY